MNYALVVGRYTDGMRQQLDGCGVYLAYMHSTYVSSRISLTLFKEARVADGGDPVTAGGRNTSHYLQH